MDDLTAEVASALADLAQRRQIIGYGALARQLAIPGPGAIAKLTGALEALMAEDAELGRPVRAALCYGRLSGDMPAPGFFERAAALGLYDGADEESFVRTQRELLFGLAPSSSC